MRTTGNEGLKLEYGIPASTPLLFVMSRADEMQAALDGAVTAAGELGYALGPGEAQRRFSAAAGAIADAHAAVGDFAAFLEDSGLRDAAARAD